MVRITLVLLAVGLAVSVTQAEWKPAAAPLMTQWGREVTPASVWREYPRPQMIRTDWANLNGLWDYAITGQQAEPPTEWNGQILVPFCVESALSGVGKPVLPDQVLWYRRSIEVPAGWAGQRVVLHFGAVDFEAQVRVNGKAVLTHRGGNNPFQMDITDFLTGGQGELIVRVTDPTDTKSQPRGKQQLKPEGIWYTAVTGIWQTVWLEPVNATSIRRVVFTPNIDTGEVTCAVDVVGGAGSVVVAAADTGKEYGAGVPGRPFKFKVENPKLWSPDSPHLYEVTVGLRTGERDAPPADQVASYFAMRKISLGPDEKGRARMLLNNKPVFQFGPLDQGWWPDGLLTPPSDAALRYDVEVLKKLGFNMLRKHIKVEPARFYRHCDELGMLVWQDMPSGFLPRTQGVPAGGATDAVFDPADAKHFRAELQEMLDHLRGFACIVVWVPFNEGWGQHDTNAILKWTKDYDPSRLVNGPSGWEDRGYGDLKDMHRYPGPGMFPAMPDRATVLGEFGGLGLPMKGHLWQDRDNWGYQSFQTKEDLSAAYDKLIQRLHVLIGRGLSAAIYTQTTDVEGEVNGLLTYDRAVLKFDADTVAKWHAALAGPPPVMQELVPTSEQTAQTWQYRFDEPGEKWQRDLTGDGWQTGPGGFGTKSTPNTVVGTEWATPNIWIRREFELSAEPTGDVFLRLFHDEDADVFINGVKALSVKRWTTGYDEFALSAEAKAALKPGKNVLAARCKQTTGGQFIDMGLVEVRGAAGR